MRSILSFVILCGLAACNRDGPELRRADGTPFSTSGGEVALADGSRLEFVITSQRYKQWDVAQRALSRNVAARFGALLQPKSPTERTIARAVAYLESDPGARKAIESSGMSVKDFVLMTVALEQEMRVASGQTAGPPTPAATPLPYPIPIDTTPAALPVVPKVQIDSTMRADTAISPAPHDSVKRDSMPPKPTRDTARDTTRKAPPDSLLRM
jgi:hypothetical protein